MLFIDQSADFLAAVQIIVYGGAIVILFLFVIMLLGVDRREARSQDKMRGLTPVAIVVSLVALVELLVLTQVRFWATGAKASTEALNGPGENVQKLGQSIFTAYLLPFEMTSALLVIAVVAAVVLVRRDRTAALGRSARPLAAAAHLSRKPYDQGRRAMTVPGPWYLVLAAVLFSIGATGALVRRNILVMYMCIELMLNCRQPDVCDICPDAERPWWSRFGVLRTGGRGR